MVSPSDVAVNYEQARGQCEPNTGLWFINGDSFSKWKKSVGSFLWMYGIPGCGSGKSILSSTIIHHVMDECRCDSGIATVYFYFVINDKAKQKTENLLSSLIAQLSAQSSQLPKAVKELYERSQNGKARPTLDRLQKTLISLFSLFNQVYVYLDALDESTDRKQLLELLSYIWETSSAHLHILVTSRKKEILS